MIYVINWWRYQEGVKCYLTKRSPNYRPYVQNPKDKDCRSWKTREAAERFLKSRDPGFAAQCIIEEVEE